MGNIILTGFMGSGKTTVGRRLANQTGLNFYDSDEEIEKSEGLSVSDIFKYKGELYFREKETEFLENNLKGFKNLVLATGGGIVLSEYNRKLLKSYGKVIYLCGTVECLYNNITKNSGFETRPVIKNNTSIENIREILDSRRAFYKDCHMIVSIDNRTIEEIVYGIMKGI